MKNLPKEFFGRTARAILFIGLVVVFCTTVSSAGMFLASRFGLTQSREQVPLTALSIGRDGEVKLPQRGKMVEGNGWKLRNSRDIYTLTLDNAVIEEAEEGEARAAVCISGDLIMELREGSGNWIHSEGVGILADSGTLVIRGNGSLEISAGQTGIDAADLELAGKESVIRAEAEDGIGIRAASLAVDEGLGQLKVSGNSGAVITAKPEPASPDLRIHKDVQITPQSTGIREFKSTFIGGKSGKDGKDGRDVRDGAGEKEAEGEKIRYNGKTFSSEASVAYDEGTGCFAGAKKEITLTGK